MNIRIGSAKQFYTSVFNTLLKLGRTYWSYINPIVGYANAVKTTYVKNKELELMQKDLNAIFNNSAKGPKLAVYKGYNETYSAPKVSGKSSNVEVVENNNDTTTLHVQPNTNRYELEGVFETFMPDEPYVDESIDIASEELYSSRVKSIIDSALNKATQVAAPTSVESVEIEVEEGNKKTKKPFVPYSDETIERLQDAKQTGKLLAADVERAKKNESVKSLMEAGLLSRYNPEENIPMLDTGDDVVLFKEELPSIFDDFEASRRIEMEKVARSIGVYVDPNDARFDIANKMVKAVLKEDEIKAIVEPKNKPNRNRKSGPAKSNAKDAKPKKAAKTNKKVR